MKLLYLPLLNPAPDGASEQHDLATAFQAAFDTRVFDYLASPDPENELRRIFAELQPDICHGQYQEEKRITPGVLAELKAQRPGCIFSQWSGDVRPRIMQTVVDLGRAIDYTLLSNTGQLPLYAEAIGKSCYYWQNAVGPSFIVDDPPGGEKIVFCGNYYKDCFSLSAERYALVHALREAFGDRFVVYGNGWDLPTAGGCHWRGQTRIYASAFCSIGHNHEIWSSYFSDRQLIAMAAGRPHVCRWMPELDEIFDNGNECTMYRTSTEACVQVQWMLDHPGHALTVGALGREAVRLKHTWDTRVREFREILHV